MRNAEVIRQWKILKTIEAGRYTTAADLAGEHPTTGRTGARCGGWWRATSSA